MTGSWERSKYSGKWGYTEEIAVMCIYLLEDYVKNFGTRRDRVGKAKLDEKYARSLGQFYFPGDNSRFNLMRQGWPVFSISVLPKTYYHRHIDRFHA